MAKSQKRLLRNLPELQGLAGSCVALDDLGSSLLAETPEGDAVRITTKDGKLYLPLKELCSEEQPWTDDRCSRRCPPETDEAACIARRGCVHVYAWIADAHLKNAEAASMEQLAPALGKCAASNGLVGSGPVGSTWGRADAGKGLVVKGADGDMVLSFPESAAGAQEEPCVEGVDASPRPPASSWPSSAARKLHVLRACRCTYWRSVDMLGGVRDVVTDYAFAEQRPEEFLQVEYGCWRNVLSKSLRMPVQFEYIATADTGNHGRSEQFALDETEGLAEWQPPRWSRSDKYGKPYDVGHLVMANHFDSNKELIVATNLMTNVVPQLGNMNRFAWLATEMLTECARERTPLENVFVIGGCVWPEQADHIKGFKKMEKVGYRILIPDACWKIIATPQRGHVAFYIPNTEVARISRSKARDASGVERGLKELNQFVVSVADLEQKLSSRQTPQSFSMSEQEKSYRPSAAEMMSQGWTLGCDMK